MEPDGVEQIIPSHETTPRSSPPIAQPSSIIRPSVELVATTSLTATNVSPSSCASSVGCSIVRYSPREDPREIVLQPLRRDRGEKADAAEIDADHRDPRAEQPRERAQDRPVAADGDHELRALGLVHELHTGAVGDRPHPLDGGADVYAAVRDDRGGLNRRVLARSARRGHREARVV